MVLSDLSAPVFWRVSPVRGMALHVVPQQAGPAEAPGADGAGVGSLGGAGLVEGLAIDLVVGLVVGVQAGRGGEGLVAHRAAEDALTGDGLGEVPEPGRALPNDGRLICHNDSIYIYI